MRQLSCLCLGGMRIAVGFVDNLGTTNEAKIHVEGSPWEICITCGLSVATFLSKFGDVTEGTVKMAWAGANWGNAINYLTRVKKCVWCQVTHALVPQFKVF